MAEKNLYLLVAVGLAVACGCRAAVPPKPPEHEPTELELKIRLIEGSKGMTTKGATARDRSLAEIQLEYWTRRFDEETGKVTAPAVFLPGPLGITEDFVLEAYRVRLRGIEAYEDLMLTDPTFGPSPEARKGIARRRSDAERMVGTLTGPPDGAPVPAEAKQWQAEILRKRKSLLVASPPTWQKPLLEEMVHWWEKFGPALSQP